MQSESDPPVPAGVDEAERDQATGPAAATAKRPSETFLQADIARSADYRKEYYKYALGIATALLAFSISFQPTLRIPPERTGFEVAGWIFLAIAIAAGVRLHMVWSKYYASFQKFDNKGRRELGKSVRDRCNLERHIEEWVLLLGLIGGVAGIVVFTASNLKNVALKTDDKPAVERIFLPTPVPPVAVAPAPEEKKFPSARRTP
jgi:hypothetical protein